MTSPGTGQEEEYSSVSLRLEGCNRGAGTGELIVDLFTWVYSSLMLACWKLLLLLNFTPYPQTVTHPALDHVTCQDLPLAREESYPDLDFGTQRILDVNPRQPQTLKIARFLCFLCFAGAPAKGSRCSRGRRLVPGKRRCWSKAELDPLQVRENENTNV